MLIFRSIHFQDIHITFSGNKIRKKIAKKGFIYGKEIYYEYLFYQTIDVLIYVKNVNVF